MTLKMALVIHESSPDILQEDVYMNEDNPRKRPLSPATDEQIFSPKDYEDIPCCSEENNKAEPTVNMPKPKTVRECMDLAFNMVLRAMYLSEDLKEKQNLHDISVVHREYQEFGKISWARSILGQEIRALEKVSRQLGNQAQNSLQKSPQLKQTINQSTPESTGIQSQTTGKGPAKMSFAEVAASNNASASDKSTSSNMTKTGYQKLAKSPASQGPKKCRQLVLITPDNLESNINSMLLRNSINDAFDKAGAQKPVILTVNRSLMRKNIVLTTTDSFTAEYLLEKKGIWEHLIPHESCQINEPWHKVVIHGVPIGDFDNEDFGKMIKDEIRTFNHGLQIIGNPYWLTSAERRPQQFSGSIVVAFATEKEATTAIRNRLYIAGRSLKVEKQYSIAPTNQCNHCQGYGHLESKCNRPERCQICAGSHHTRQHKCSSCSAKGKACVHSLLKCVNCGQSHKANDLSCEVYRILKDGPSQNTEAQAQDNATHSL